MQDTDEEKAHDVECNDLEKPAYHDYTQQPTEEFEASSKAEEDEEILSRWLLMKIKIWLIAMD